LVGKGPIAIVGLITSSIDCIMSIGDGLEEMSSRDYDAALAKNLAKRIKLSDDDETLQTEKTSLEKQVQELETGKKEIEQKLATHTEYETRLREAKKVIKEIKDRKEDLIAKARENITPDEAKELILARWKNVLSSTIMTYVADYQRGFLNRLENLYEKYTVTINEILEEREKESAQLAGFLKELGYE